MNRRQGPGRPRYDRLYRDPDHGKLLGVCAGIADYFGINAWICRSIAIFGLVLFTIPTVIAYFLAGALLERKPDDMYASREEEELWRDIRTRPQQNANAIRHRFRGLERRLRGLEAYITSKEFALQRDLRDLER